jgi:aspartyl-tRNA(Asn)/glutamyl-tRNA(Gln) amidotransferase subunit A
MPSLRQTHAAFALGQVSCQELTERALDKARANDGEGRRVFTQLYQDRALDTARALDRLRKAAVPAAPMAGLVVSIKDLFDEQGHETLAGSLASKGSGAASQDAPVVAALRRAGAVIVGRTTMTEYAYSGLGLNPHYGTPRSPWDRATGRIPGGSSSGAGVSVSDGMAMAALGTDTGGSVRIPSALCGITGFKPTARRISRQGVFPLSQSLDSIGPLAASVEDCALIDHVISGATAPFQPPLARPAKGSRFAVPTTLVLDRMDSHVAETFTETLTLLSDAGAVIEDITLPQLAEIPPLNSKGGLSGAEAFALHRQRIATHGADYDPRVLGRILKGADQSAADYIDLLQARARLCQEANILTQSFDALLLPTVPTIAPAIAPLEADDTLYGDLNLLMLRNPSLFNMLDRCAFSIPCHRPAEAPVGLMVVGQTMGDQALFSVAAGIEQALIAGQRNGGAR